MSLCFQEPQWPCSQETYYICQPRYHNGKVKKVLCCVHACNLFCNQHKLIIFQTLTVRCFSGSYISSLFLLLKVAQIKGLYLYSSYHCLLITYIVTKVFHLALHFLILRVKQGIVLSAFLFHI